MSTPAPVPATPGSTFAAVFGAILAAAVIIAIVVFLVRDINQPSELDCSIAELHDTQHGTDTAGEMGCP